MDRVVLVFFTDVLKERILVLWVDGKVLGNSPNKH